MRNKLRTYEMSGTYSCGHKGTLKQRAYTEDYAWETLRAKFAGKCPECAKEENRKKYEEVNKENAEKAEKLGLIELKGTEKQIAWAETIRMTVAKRIDDCREYRDEFTVSSLVNDFGIRFAPDTTMEEAVKKYNAVLDEIKEHLLNQYTTAGKWIDERNYYLHHFGFDSLPMIWKNMQEDK